jgi:hypothetical protein
VTGVTLFTAHLSFCGAGAAPRMPMRPVNRESLLPENGGCREWLRRKSDGLARRMRFGTTHVGPCHNGFPPGMAHQPRWLNKAYSPSVRSRTPWDYGRAGRLP